MPTQTCWRSVTFGMVPVSGRSLTVVLPDLDVGGARAWRLDAA